MKIEATIWIIMKISTLCDAITMHQVLKACVRTKLKINILIYFKMSECEQQLKVERRK